ncbi:hypothetical protein B5V02_32255 [Mesorhizobium kowhaii]|uniref:Uncharacterized protein n=1 Tax=Mesorhizobium kowhaii TaxID=1300272 RepID=A0A2W7CL01_9HYPH|nr:hypothetical protein B5V02_32255 [Mesorhizobium kowhaii]
MAYFQPFADHTRAIRFGRYVSPFEANSWLFPADSESGHLAEQKDDRDVLGKWGNDLRQTFRTLATAAGVSEFDARLLMNHAIPGVNAGYISRHKLLEDHQRIQQQAISATMFGALGNLIAKDDAVRSWLGPCATRRAIQVAMRNDGEALRDEYRSVVFVRSADPSPPPTLGICQFGALKPAATPMTRAMAPAIAIGTPRISSAVSMLGRTGR